MTRREALRLIGAGVGVATLTPPLSAQPTPNASTGPTPLLTRPVPSSGERLPVIGMGTWQTFDVGPAPAERAPLEAVLAAFAAGGGRVVDSSPMYGRSEDVAGELMEKQGLRSKLFVATKVWTTGREQGIAQMRDSMRKLRAQPVDLMQVHNLVDVDTHLATLRDWKQQGLVRHLGITHYTAGSHEAVARLVASQALDFIQINYSVGEREAEQRLLPLALERGVAVIINRPFAGGDLLRRLRSKPLPTWAGEIGCTSWAQLLLKFVISHPAVTCAIPATSRPEHMLDNLGAGRGPLPDPAIRARIAAEAV